MESRLACAVGAGFVVLALAVGGHGIDGDVDFLELLARADHAVFAHHPLELRNHQAGALVDDGFKARNVIGQARHLGVDAFELRLHRVEPQRRAHDLVAHAQRVEHFSARLANGDGRLGRLLELQRHAAVVNLHGMAGRLRGLAGGQTCGQQGGSGNEARGFHGEFLPKSR